MPFLANKRDLLIDNSGNYEWGKTYLWDIRFPDAPAPFNAWFPATDVSINVYTMNIKEWEFYLSSYSVPYNTSEFDINITYSDDARRVLLDWFSDWVNTVILNGETLVTPLRQAVRQVTVQRLNARRELLKESSYWVYPNESANFEANSDSGLASNEVQLKIAGFINSSH